MRYELQRIQLAASAYDLLIHEGDGQRYVELLSSALATIDTGAKIRILKDRHCDLLMPPLSVRWYLA